jgi:hypothetical protein
LLVTDKACPATFVQLEDPGYSVEKKPGRKSNMKPSELDKGKKAPCSLFYAPCQAQNPENSFFEYYNGPELELLNPITWIENVVPFKAPSAPRELAPAKGRWIDEAMVQTATEEWRESPKYPGEGNDRFFQYALVLRDAGMEPVEIEAKLMSEAQDGRSPDERRDQVLSIMTSLRKST